VSAIIGRKTALSSFYECLAAQDHQYSNRQCVTGHEKRLEAMIHR
jgi:hypothetical protein